MDRQMYLEQLEKQEAEAKTLRANMLAEFSRFASCFMQCKLHLQEGHVLDAYSLILEALCHWAKIALLEEKVQPGALLWEQVRTVNPGVYKLYEELAANEETLEQRTRLAVLACEFGVMTKMEKCCELLIDVIASRKQAWSLQELREAPELAGLDRDLDLHLLLTLLAKKSFVREVAEAGGKPESILLELKYTV
jgi:hypothetical protein